MHSTTIRQEFAGDVNGVSGRFHNVVIWPRDTSLERIRGLIAIQKWVSTFRPINPRESLQVTLRYDDQCKNGHESFSITGNIVEDGRSTGGGCVHDLIAKHFPELAHLIKWHLCASDGPMHYIANTVYFAGDRDCNGLLKGESRQIVNGRTGEPCWQLRAVDGRSLRELATSLDSAECPTEVPVLSWQPWCRIGEGKVRELNAARAAAIWPDAPDDVLLLPKDQLSAVLAGRLPGLIEEFKAEMLRTGFLLAA